MSQLVQQENRLVRPLVINIISSYFRSDIVSTYPHEIPRIEGAAPLICMFLFHHS